MSKLKKLSNEDLVEITETFGQFLNDEVYKKISFKELEDFSLDFSINYENEELFVDVDLGVAFDELSDINQELLNEALDNSYLRLDSYIEDNFKE